MNLKVLNVDDDMINRKLLTTMLKKVSSNIDIVEAEDGQKALEKLKSEKFDIVLLDIIMPVMGGLDVISIMKDDDNLKSIPIIILTTDETKRVRH